MVTHSPLPLTSAQDVWQLVETLDMWHMRLGLERIKAVLQGLNNPQNQFPTIHLVGTNGKGSTSAMLASVYRHGGYTTGLFTSPHLMHVSERLLINGQPIEEAVVVESANRVIKAMAPEDPLTYFEFLTALAFVCFAQAGVHIALIEAGLGGRLDSTHVLAKPLAVVVTPISLDHQDRLGHTLRDIAREKAAVFKPGVPVFSAPQLLEAAIEITESAKRSQSPLTWVAPETLTLGDLSQTQGAKPLRLVQTPRGPLKLGLLGRYQHTNLAVALSVLENLDPTIPVSAQAVAQGLEHVDWPGRLMWFPEAQLIVDGSHNEAGIEALLETLAIDFKDWQIDWGLALLNNRHPEVLKPLVASPQTHRVAWIAYDETKPFFPAPTLMARAQEWTLKPQSQLDLGSFCQNPPQPNILRVLTGSLYQAGEALNLLKSTNPLQGAPVPGLSGGDA